MSEQQNRLQKRIAPEIQSLRDQARSLMLATINPDGTPNVSYAPFALDQEGYYILISDIARHGRNLKVNPYVSLMIIEDEGAAKQLFARERLTFEALANMVERETDLWRNGIAQLQERHGDMIGNLSQLGDFNLFCLKPVAGLYVRGFGQAYQVSGDDLVEVVHLKEGHQRLKDAG
ncbi:heme utilization protein HutZ [Nitrincola sp. MINF-07-Sa-05]|uniref:heme utilization protein HutZ n=1 Tax=Nitrincola salilacus TaxID=3400273 RepID=UPI003917CDB8